LYFLPLPHQHGALRPGLFFAMATSALSVPRRHMTGFRLQNGVSGNWSDRLGRRVIRRGDAEVLRDGVGLRAAVKGA
jgi:hypothetical protein